MDEFEMRSRINGYIKEISHYSQMQVFATSYYQKNYFQMQIDEAANSLIHLYFGSSTTLPEKRQMRTQQQYRNEQEPSQELQQEPEPEQAAEEETIPQTCPQETPVRRFTLEELAYYDGKEGRPSYVAVNGVVYDVSNTKLWDNGRHFGQDASADQTVAFMGCHLAMPGVLQRIPQVGVLE